jgi:hypothetical protein
MKLWCYVSEVAVDAVIGSVVRGIQEGGIGHQTLARRWKDPYSPWMHESMYHVSAKGHVMMRIKSQVYVEGGMTAAAKCMLLYSRGDYTPYFSVCSHWKDGILMTIPKCALDHIPFVPTAFTPLQRSSCMSTTLFYNATTLFFNATTLFFNATMLFFHVGNALLQCYNAPLPCRPRSSSPPTNSTNVNTTP